MMNATPTTPVDHDASPLRELVGIALPVVAAMTSFTLMQFVDKVMVSRIGPDPIYVGAQGNGGLMSFVPISIAMGAVTVVNTFVSQNLGAGKPREGVKYVWAAVWIAIAYWLIVLLPCAAGIGLLMDRMRDPSLSGEALARAVWRDGMAVDYGRILLAGGFATLICRAFSQYFYGMHAPRIVLVATLAGAISNIVLNCVLIYGPTPPTIGVGWIDAWFGLTGRFCVWAGVPRLEVAGAACATVLATLVELCVPMVVFLSKRNAKLHGTRAWKPDWRAIKGVLNIGWPSGLMFGNEMVCWSFFMVYLVGQFGPVHSTAGWIAHQYMSLSFMPTVGISVAITAMVGKCIGMGRHDLAQKRAWLGVKVAVTYMTLCGVLFVVFRGTLVRWFLDERTPAEDVANLVRLGSAFLVATAAFQFFDGIAMTLSGALRGAGDTRWPGVATVLLSWSLIVAGGLAMIRFFPGLESVGAWIAAATYITALSGAMLWRFTSGKWKEIRLLEGGGGREEGAGGG